MEPRPASTGRRSRGHATRLASSAWAFVLASSVLGPARAQAPAFDAASVGNVFDPALPAIFGAGESFEFVGRPMRVRLEGPIALVRNEQPVEPRGDVYELRTRDRFVLGDTPGDARILPVPRTTSSPALPPVLLRVVATSATRRDGTAIRSICPFVPSLESDAEDEASAVTLSLGTWDGPTRLRVVTTAGSERSTRDADVTTAVRVVATRRVAPRDPPALVAVEARPGDLVELVARTNGVLRASVSVGSDAASRCASRTVRVALTVVTADSDSLSPAGPTRAAVDANLDAMLDDTARALAACGISVVEARARRTASPPRPNRISIGEGDGLPAVGGGQVRFRVERDDIVVTTRPGATPVETAADVARAVEAAGYVARVVTLPRIDRAAYPAADVDIRRTGGELARVEAIAGVPVSSDPRQRVSIGRVEFADGLDEVDADFARTGTLEERALLGAFVDDDEATIDLVLVERFGDASRTGEAFVPRDGGPFPASIILDRRAISLHAGLLTVPHEIGHVLMNDAFHPAIANVASFERIMAGGATDPESGVARTFTREECNRMRERGRAFLVAP